MELYYYVDKHAGYNDNHVVHATGCPFLPSDGARRFLGTFYTATAAIQQASKVLRQREWGVNIAARWR
jgi:hypothetical protein